MFFVAYILNASENYISIIISDGGYFYKGEKVSSLEDLRTEFFYIHNIYLNVCPNADAYLIERILGYLSNYNVNEIQISSISFEESNFLFCQQ